MKTDTLKKSLLDYAIKGKLTARFRRENNGLNAFNEINTYNEAIKEKRKNLEKELKKCEKELKLEKDKDKKAFFKSQIQMLKKELTKCKEITPLFCQESRFFANAQNDKKACHTASTCHTDLECSEREVSKNTESQLVILSECEKSNTESKRDFSFATQTQNAVSLENDNAQTPPFEIPNSWAWVKLGDICEITMGQSPEQNQFIDFSPTAQNDKKACHTERSEVSYFEFHQGKILFGEKFIEKSNIFVKGAVKVANTNSILLCVRAPVGIVNITQRKIAIGRGLCALKSEFCNNDLLYFILQSMQTYFEKKATGSTFKAINIDIVKQTLIPLPPLKEQQEIVKKLDLLVSLANDFAITKENLKRI
ncbi:restriction endonuclease subunit S [Helicobacter bilis]|uniref:restriction endonuclease subunit S n=1 Tax=Helicobacter bilis TaxID=37372 RepID=UPI0018F81159|nr:restriction endonuclease subunit S [Helicobacter bilis]